MTTIGAAPERVAWLKWIDRTSILLAVFGALMVVGLMLNIVVDVFGRYLFNNSLPGTLDLARFAWMPSLISLGLGYALLRGEHIRVNLLTSPTSRRTQRVVEVISMTFTLVVTGLFIWYSKESAMATMSFNEKAVGTPWLAIWPYRWVLVAGLSGLFLQSAACLVRAITVEEFVPYDADEAETAVEAGETVFDATKKQAAVTGKVEN